MKKIVKLAAIFMTALILCCTALLGTACGRTNTPNNSNSGSTENPATPTQPTAPENPYAKYSPTLQKVLKSEEYQTSLNELITFTRGGHKTSEYSKINYHVGHPYGFLQKQGYNSDAIKNGYTECLSDAYTSRVNEFYIKTMVAVNADIPYYDCYVLEYELTKQEKEDLDFLFKGNYHQAPFFIQQLSYDKTPKVVSHAKHSIDAYKELSQSFRNTSKFSKDILLTYNVAIILADFEIDTYTNFYTINLYKKDNQRTYEIRSAIMTTLKFNSPAGNVSEMICCYPTQTSSLHRTHNYTVFSINWYNTQNIFSSHNNLLEKI